MSARYGQIEEKIKQAIDDLRTQSKPNIAATTRKFDVPRQRLQHRFKGNPSKIESGGQNKKLSEAQEKAICQFLDHLDSNRPKARYKQLEQAANSLLEKDYQGKGSAPTVGPHWAERFLKRHLLYFVRKQKPLAVEQKNAKSPETIKQHFDEFKEAKTSHGVADGDVYNFDETGFRVGCGRQQKVITKEEKARVVLEDPENRDFISSLECVSGDGSVIPNMIILSGKNHLEKFFLHNDLDGKVAMAVSDTGHNNDELSLHWLEHFDKHTRKKRRGVWRILVMDGASSHVHEEFIRLCYSKNILPFRLPPHTTHLLQPLEVVCFQPLKHYHAEAVDNAVQTGDAEFTRVEFLAHIQSIRKQTFKKSTVLLSFRKTGLIPFDPQVVLDRLPPPTTNTTSDSLQPPVTPPHRITQKMRSFTPTTVRDFTYQATMLANSDYSPSTQTDIQKKYLRGSLVRINSGALAEDHLTRIHQVELQRAARRKGTARVVQKGGVVTVSKAREKIADRVHQELVIANRAQLRAQKKVHMAECGPWLEALKEAKDILSIRKQDRKRWQGLFIKLKAELKAFCKPTQKVVTGVACSVRWQALGQRSSAFRESIR